MGTGRAGVAQTWPGWRAAGNCWDRGFKRCEHLCLAPGSLELRKVREEVEPGESWLRALGWGLVAEGAGTGPLAWLPGSGGAMRAELLPPWTLGCLALGICT